MTQPIRPSLLWITQEVPDRGGGGGAIRQAELLVRLGDRFAVDLVVGGPLADRAVRAAARSVVEVPAPAVRPLGRLRTAWELGARRRALFLGASAGARRALRRAVEGRFADHDAVVIHHEELLPLLAVPGPVLRVLHVFDVKGDRAEQLAGVARSTRSGRVWRAEAAAARRAERRWLPAADLVVGCSAEDLTALERAAGTALPGVVVPNGVDLEAVRPVPPPRDARVLFLGSLDYEPNVDGITWFAEAVWPSVLAAVPGATLTVAGRRPGPRVTALGALEGVDVVGPVPDAARCLADHAVVVVPLRVGTGSRLKALEAMAAGRPTVGTTVGLEGLGLPASAGDQARVGDAPAVVVDDPAQLAGAVARLLQDRDLAAAVGAAGRTFVEQRSGWDRIADGLAAALLERLGTAPADGAGASVLVCTRRRPELLARSLPSIAAALRPGDELLVVESGGVQGAPVVATLGPAARHLVAAPGKSRQLNAGLRAARHDTVVLTDDDCEVEPGWVAAMAAPFADPAVAVAFGDVQGLSGVRAVAVPPLVPGAPPPVTWAYANGAAMAVRRRAVLDVGGFDERLGPGAPVHGEEHDLVLRLQEAGCLVRIADAPPVRHLGWRDDAATRRNLLVYSQGAGAFVGAALRRAPRRWARLAARRARYQASLWRHGASEGWGFGPRTSWAFLRGVARGLAMRPVQRRRRPSS